jgi:flagellar biosynthesis GTPase FlhF
MSDNETIDNIDICEKEVDSILKNKIVEVLKPHDKSKVKKSEKKVSKKNKSEKSDESTSTTSSKKNEPIHLNQIKKSEKQSYVSVTPTHLVIHNTFQKTYNCNNCSDEPYMMNQTIIPPKVFMFYNKEQAQEFYSDYINDIDEIDERCKKGQEIEHVNYCICGVLELDDDGNPIFFNNKKNHIYLLEVAGTIMSVPYKLKHEIHTMNSTISNLKKYKTLSGEQINKYIQLGKMCEECLNDNTMENDDE